MPLYPTIPDHVRNTLARQAGLARSRRFEPAPLHPEPSTAQLRALEALLKTLEARNREILASLRAMRL